MTEKKKITDTKAFKISMYSAADLLGGGVGQVLSIYYLSFLLYVAGLSPLMAGLVTGIGKAWDGITDPVMGVIVDRTKTKYGSCKPWMLIAVVPVFISYFMLWYSFGITGVVGKFVYYIFAYMLWSTAFTIGIIPYEALLPRMVSTYKERTDYSSMRMIFSGVGCVVSTYIYEFLIPVSAENPLSPAFTQNFAILGLVLGAFFALPLLITAFGTKENPIEKPIERMTVKTIFLQYKEVLKNKIYRKYFALSLSGTFVSSAISACMAIFVYLTYGNIQNFVLTFTLLFIVLNVKGAFEIGFFPVNIVLMKKFNKHRPYLTDIPLLLAGSILIAFVNSSSPIWLMLIAVSLIGMGVSCLGFVPMSLLPDLSDVDELIYGKRREGVNAGLTTLGKKLVSGLAITVFGFVLEAFNLDTTSASPDAATPKALLAVKLMYCAVPAIFCTIMLIISRTYNLDQKAHDMLKRIIAEKRETGTVSVTEEEKKSCEKITGFKFEDMWIGKEI